MADKEERIVIVSGLEDKKLVEQWPFFGGCESCPATINECNEMKCLLKDKPITKSQAIEKIAKCIYFWETDGIVPVPWEDLPEDIKNFRKSNAEAALNALLENNK